jgi:hypothetical protein
MRPDLVPWVENWQSRAKIWKREVNEKSQNSVKVLHRVFDR